MEKNKILTKKEMKRLFKNAKKQDNFLYVLLLISYEYALRLNEAVNLMLIDINFKKMQIKIKNRECSIKQISPEIALLLKEYISTIRTTSNKNEKHLFLTSSGKPINHDVIRSHLEKCLKKSKINKIATFYLIRRTKIHLLIEEVEMDCGLKTGLIDDD